jgi:hypothetical protein
MIVVRAETLSQAAEPKALYNTIARCRRTVQVWIRVWFAQIAELLLVQAFIANACERSFPRSSYSLVCWVE